MNNEEQFDPRPQAVARPALQPTEDELRMLQTLRDQNKGVPLALSKGGELVVDYGESIAVAAQQPAQPAAEPVVDNQRTQGIIIDDTPDRLELPSMPDEPIVVNAPIAEPAMGDFDAAELSTQQEVPKQSAAPLVELDQEEPELPKQAGRDIKAIAHRVNPNIQYRPEKSQLNSDSILLEIPGLSSFGIPPELAEQEFNKLLEGAQYDPVKQRWIYLTEEQEIAAEAISVAANNHSPKWSSGEQAQTRALLNPNASWDQQILLPDNTAMSLVRSHGNQDNSALGRVRRARGTGVPVTLYMPTSGFFVTYRTPHEREFVDMDLRMASETGILGVSTYGLLMSASSSVYLKHLIESTMQYVTETSLNLEGRDMTTMILANLDMADAMLFILGPIIAKFPGGLPWDITCPISTCGDTEQILLNMARCIRAGNGLFSSAQLDYILRTRGKLVTLDEVAKYRSFAIVPESHVFTRALADGLSLTVEWKHSTAFEFFDHANSWIETNNKITNSAMMEHADEVAREAHLRIVADQRRLVRNIHFVGALVLTDADGGTERIEEQSRIIEILEEMSEDKIYVLAFEAALANYIEDSRLVVFGYMAHPCPACKNDPTPIKEGAFRGIVPIAPDRIFFTLSRVVSAIQRQLATQFANIG